MTVWHSLWQIRNERVNHVHIYFVVNQASQWGWGHRGPSPRTTSPGCMWRMEPTSLSMACVSSSWELTRPRPSQRRLFIRWDWKVSTHVFSSKAQSWNESKLSGSATGISSVLFMRYLLSVFCNQQSPQKHENTSANRNKIMHKRCISALMQMFSLFTTINNDLLVSSCYLSYLIPSISCGIFFYIKSTTSGCWTSLHNIISCKIQTWDW